MKECCDNCWFYREQWCRRYPTEVLKDPSDFCGEFRPKKSLKEIEGENFSQERKKKVLLND